MSMISTQTRITNRIPEKKEPSFRVNPARSNQQKSNQQPRREKPELNVDEEPSSESTKHQIDVTA